MTRAHFAFRELACWGIKYFEPNKNYIPVCYGDRVRILFVNTLDQEGHPIHLHGHDFTLRKSYNIGEGNVLTENTTKYDISRPKLDDSTIFIPYSNFSSYGEMHVTTGDW